MKRNNREEMTLLFGKMYKEENKSIKEIAKETNYSEFTVRNYLSNGNYLPKRGSRTRKNISSVNIDEKYIDEPVQDDSFDTEISSNNDKPYEQLDGNYVLYKGRIYEKLTKDQLRRLLREDLKIKNKRRKKV